MQSVNRPAPIIFGKMHFLLIPENEFFHAIKCNGVTSFIEFMQCVFDNSVIKQPSKHRDKCDALVNSAFCFDEKGHGGERDEIE